MSNKDKELIWVEKEFAKQHKELMSDKNRRDEQLKVFQEYIDGIKDSSVREFKANLESLEEDAAMYTGLMLKVKKTFEAAKNEQLTASYDLWENFEKQLPSTRDKIETITKLIQPLSEQVEHLNKELNKISTFDIERIAEAIRSLASLSGDKKDMIDFLIQNFKKK